MGLYRSGLYGLDPDVFHKHLEIIGKRYRAYKHLSDKLESFYHSDIENFIQDLSSLEDSVKEAYKEGENGTVRAEILKSLKEACDEAIKMRSFMQQILTSGSENGVIYREQFYAELYGNAKSAYMRSDINHIKIDKDDLEKTTFDIVRTDVILHKE